MAKVDLTPIKSGYNLQRINDNFRKIEDNINNHSIQRDDKNNTMNQDLDMDGNKIINVKTDKSDPRSLVTMEGLTSQLANLNYGEYDFIGDYSKGVTLSGYNQLVRDKDGEFWRVSGKVNLPYTLTGLGVDEGGALVSVGDATLRQDLANPDKGAAMIGWGDRTVGKTLDLLTHSFAYAQDYGIVGSTPGNLIDETAKFVAACNDCREKGIKLNIGTLKIYLPTLTAPINLDGLLVYGEGDVLYAPKDDWGVPRGLYDEGVYVIPNALAQECAILIHTGFDGPLFTGKQFNAQNLGILGKFSSSSNCAFVQSTPKTYPGWSRGLLHTDRVSIAYTGSHGIHLLGGLELIQHDWPLISTRYCGGYGLFIETTAGIECPVEYLRIDKGGFTSSRLANIRIKGVRKDIEVGAVVLNDPGMIRLIPGGAVPGTTAPTTEDNMVPGIQIDLNGIAAPYNIRLNGVVAEVCNLLVKTTGHYTTNLVIENSIQFPVYNEGWKWRTGLMTHATSRNSTLRNNRGNLPGSAVFSYRNHTSADVSIETDRLTKVYGVPTNNVITPFKYDLRSETIGDGTAGTFTSSMVEAIETPSNGTAGYSELFSVVANFQAGQYSTAGAYLLLVTKVPNGNYVGIAFEGSSTAGFTAAPSVDNDGLISIPLNEYYRARVTRLDRGILSTAIVPAP